MNVILGIVIVIGCIIGGYLMEHGHLLVLYQPAELVIIGGAALGTVFIANSFSNAIALFKGVLGVFAGSKYTRKFYIEQLRMLADVFNYARKNGIVKLEADVEDPSKSQLFSKYPGFVKDHFAVHFFCDTLRMSITGGVNSHDLEQMMEMDMEVHHAETAAPVHALTTVSDALPGLGIVAAVLGIVVTMGALGGPPEEIGHKVAAALVGTFLGVLLCYGFLGPMAARMTAKNEEHTHYLHFLRVGLMSFVKGSAPILALEFARRTIPFHVRPSFSEMEAASKFQSGGAEAAAA
jgi:chemotaxis protein MotA